MEWEINKAKKGRESGVGKVRRRVSGRYVGKEIEGRRATYERIEANDKLHFHSQNQYMRPCYITEIVI